MIIYDSRNLRKTSYRKLSYEADDAGDAKAKPRHGAGVLLIKPRHQARIFSA